MKLTEICEAVDGRVVCGADGLDREVGRAFASDLMSDVLTLKDNGFLLLTGLANVQSVRTADMSDAGCLLLCRGKRASAEMRELADENGMVILESPYSMFKCAGLLFAAGLEPVY
ncbi:PucR family transcriptional regulator ligand-binding domain-containing protein [Alistipes sp. OttesenSCG-928-L06]|nr:PucR family transcriptional regulator ligand-binding domain-containing protein [Alistipes sp. OttesenSCG-928-L06]